MLISIGFLPSSTTTPNQKLFFGVPSTQFHTADGAHRSDAQGTDLPREKEARLRAVVLITEILREDPNLLAPSKPFRVEAQSEQRQFEFSAVVTITAKRAGG